MMPNSIFIFKIRRTDSLRRSFARLYDFAYLYFKIGAAQHIVSCLYRPDGNLRIPGELPYSFHDQIIGNDHAVKP